MLTRNLQIQEPYLVNGSRGEVISFKSSTDVLKDVTAELELLGPSASPYSPGRDLDPTLARMRDLLFFQQDGQSNSSDQR